MIVEVIKEELFLFGSETWRKPVTTVVIKNDGGIVFKIHFYKEETQVSVYLFKGRYYKFCDMFELSIECDDLQEYIKKSLNADIVSNEDLENFVTLNFKA